MKLLSAVRLFCIMNSTDLNGVSRVGPRAELVCGGATGSHSWTDCLGRQINRVPRHNCLDWGAAGSDAQPDSEYEALHAGVISQSHHVTCLPAQSCCVILYLNVDIFSQRRRMILTGELRMELPPQDFTFYTADIAFISKVILEGPFTLFSSQLHHTNP